MISLAPWFYKDLLGQNLIIESPDFYKINLITGEEVFESNVRLKDNLRPKWLNKSEIYKDCDGSGTAMHKNIAIYKAISEAIERYAFYVSIESNESEYFFDKNPSTTGMAAFPSFSTKQARLFARQEAIERWAIYQFNFSTLPIVKHDSHIKSLFKYEIIVPYKDTKVALMHFKTDFGNIFGFGAGRSIDDAFKKAVVELDRNFRVLRKGLSLSASNATVDRTLFYYLSSEGGDKFNTLLESSPSKIRSDLPRIICDKEMKGPWTKYAKVWRFLLDDSFFDASTDHTFFTF